MFWRKMVLAIEGHRSNGGNSFFEEFSSRGKGLSGDALQRVSRNDARNRWRKVRVGRDTVSPRPPPPTFSEDLSEMTMRMSNSKVPTK